MIQRRIGFLVFNGVRALDVIGPADAFASDAFDTPAWRTDGNGEHPYAIVLKGLTGRRVSASSGITLMADATVPSAVKLDTLIIPGGTGLRRSGAAERAAKWIVSRAPRTRRVASVCTGLYGLAPTKLLDGRRVATHWSAVEGIQRRYPALHVESDALFLKDGQFYTSAGITAGIDLALAMIEEDHGPAAALAVARERDGSVLQATRRTAAILRAAAIPSRIRRSLRGSGHLDPVAAARGPLGRRPRQASVHEPAALRARLQAAVRHDAGRVRSRGATGRGQPTAVDAVGTHRLGGALGGLRRRRRVSPRVRAPLRSVVQQLSQPLSLRASYSTPNGHRT